MSVRNSKRPSLPYRQLDDNAGATAAPVEQSNASVMLVDDLLRHRQPEPGAARLGREEWIENAAAHVIGNPRSAIGDRDDELRTDGLPFTFDRHLGRRLR